MKKNQIKIKTIRDAKKVFIHLALNEKFKRYSEIEGSNDRIGKAVEKMIKKGMLIKDKEGFTDFDYEKYPILAEIKTLIRRLRADLESEIEKEITKKEITKNLKISDKVLMELLNKMIDLGFNPDIK